MLKLRKKTPMTFKQFSKWCNARAADGYWDSRVSIGCLQICSDVYNQKWWRREKYFRENYYVEGIYEGTVCEINDIINYDRKVKKGEFE